MLNPFLIGDKIYLRSPEPGDESVYAVSENHPDPRSYLYCALPSSITTHEERIKLKLNDHSNIVFTICTKDDEIIGTTSFVRIDWIGRMTTYYIALAEKKNWSQGYGREATQMMVDYAFNTLNLNRIQLHVSSENLRAINAYEAAGFTKEGTLREAMYFDNRYVDFYLMSILKKEWENLKQREK
ncbi:MAG: GNAT family N-acetyltransferase [Melioribacteraceae bacterium]|nr:GNAT family N-acetyltransferase [Melioribacteraceae bacterium]